MVLNCASRTADCRRLLSVSIENRMKIRRAAIHRNTRNSNAPVGARSPAYFSYSSAACGILSRKFRLATSNLPRLSGSSNTNCDESVPLAFPYSSEAECSFGERLSTYL